MFKSKLVFLGKVCIGRIILYRRQYRSRWPERIPYNSPLPKGLVFQRITGENVELVREWKGGLHVRRFRVLLNRGHLGLFALADGRVVGFLWMAVNIGATRNWHDPTEPGEAISSRAETRPEYARMKVSFHAHAKLLELVRGIYGNELKSIWGETPTDNKKMQGLARALGCIRCQEQHVLALLGLFFFYRTWDLVPDTATRTSRGRTTIRFRIPDFIYSPWFVRLWRTPARNREQ